MVELRDEKGRFSCISCFSRDAETVGIRIGAHDNNKTVISLCHNCLDNLVNAGQKYLNGEEN